MGKVANILLVGNDQLDVINIRREIDKINILYKLKVVRNAEEAMNVLERSSLDEQTNLPDFILLNINTTGMHGMKLLQIIRSNNEWKNIKCFIISNSNNSSDKEAAQRLQISGYIVKPFKLNNPGSIDSFNLMIDLMNINKVL